MDTITTGDLYESCYYLLNGCELELIEGVRVNGKVSCRLSFKGPKITQLQLEYFQGSAEVNLFSFRRAFGQVSAYVHNAKKKFRNELFKDAGPVSGKEGGEA